MAKWSAMGRVDGRRAVRWVAPVVAVVILLLATAAAASMTSPDVTDLPFAHGQYRPFEGGPPKDSPAPHDPEPPVVAAPDEPMPLWIPGVIIGVLLAAYVAITVYLMLSIRDSVRMRRRPKPEEEEPEPTSTGASVEEVRIAVEAGLDELIDESDPRRATIACWLRLEATAARAGSPRLVSDTPADLVARMLAEHIPAGTTAARMLDQLATAYRSARYAPHEVDESTRQLARDALERLRAELTAGSRVLAGTPSGATPDRPAGRATRRGRGQR